MKLYTNLFSPNARKVHAVANELGIELETQTVDLRGGEQRTPEYLTLNPNGKVPTLVDGDTVLWESNAIMCYLAGKGDTDLWPKTAKRYDILRWMFWESNHLSNALNRLFFQKFFSGDNPDQALIERATKDFRKYATVLDTHLANNTYVTGDTLTLADFTVGVGFGYAVPLELPLEGLDSINRWWGTFSATDSGSILLPG
ncbi:MAG: glutathione S-transferase family protein [Deltaproteobacteria bacterium]|jgi:glutathione S-transferase|nr:glutathione S-transferase family protein [Deltaproteobacteria bacterium]